MKSKHELRTTHIFDPHMAANTHVTWGQVPFDAKPRRLGLAALIFLLQCVVRSPLVCTTLVVSVFPNLPLPIEEVSYIKCRRLNRTTSIMNGQPIGFVTLPYRLVRRRNEMCHCSIPSTLRHVEETSLSSSTKQCESRSLSILWDIYLGRYSAPCLQCRNCTLQLKEIEQMLLARTQTI